MLEWYFFICVFCGMSLFILLCIAQKKKKRKIDDAVNVDNESKSKTGSKGFTATKSSVTFADIGGNEKCLEVRPGLKTLLLFFLRLTSNWISGGVQTDHPHETSRSLLTTRNLTTSRVPPPRPSWLRENPTGLRHRRSRIREKSLQEIES